MSPRSRCAALAAASVAAVTFVVVAYVSHPVGATLLPSHVVPLEPARLLDTRSGPGNVTIDNLSQGEGSFNADSQRVLDVTARGGVPANATAVFLNVTAVSPSAPGFIAVYPCNVSRPIASNVNYAAGAFVPNMVLAKVDPDGNVCVYTLAATDVVIDVNGYVPAGGGVIPVTPARLLETRTGPDHVTTDGQSQGIGRLGAGSETRLRLANRATLANQARSVFVNVTVIDPSGSGFVTLYPCGTERPTASNLNYGAGDVVANAVFAQGDPSNGDVCIYTLEATDLAVDVTGYVEPAANAEVTTVAPRRLLESRDVDGFTTTDRLFEGDGVMPAGVEVPLDVAGRGGVPDNAPAAFLNITVIDPAGPGFVTAYPCGSNRPIASNLNFGPGDVVPNAVLAGVGDGGNVCLYSLVATHIVVDVNGYVAAPPVPPPVTTTCTIGVAAVDTSIPQSQCDALVEFYESTAGPSWTVRTGWLGDADPCTWYGVTCAGGHVTGLEYYANNMNGPLPPEIGDLVGLNTLSLWVNGITSVPAEIGNLTALRHLNLGNNDLTGVPAQLWTLTGLIDLRLSESGLTALPPAIAAFTDLQSLEVDLNDIAALPIELTTLPALESLNAGYNDLTGLPPGFSNLTTLTNLQLNANQIGFPAAVSSLTALTRLELFGVGLAAVPASIGNLDELTYLTVGANDLTTLPPELFTLPKLNQLNVSNNELATLPVAVADLPVLNYLNARNNPWSADLTPAMAALKADNLMEYMYVGSTSHCPLISGADLIAWVAALDPSWNQGCP